jgi:hypothetical protein
MMLLVQSCILTLPPGRCAGQSTGKLDVQARSVLPRVIAASTTWKISNLMKQV